MLDYKIQIILKHKDNIRKFIIFVISLILLHNFSFSQSSKVQSNDLTVRPSNTLILGSKPCLNQNEYLVSWKPNYGLSCVNCNNPIFTSLKDTSIIYTRTIKCKTSSCIRIDQFKITNTNVEFSGEELLSNTEGEIDSNYFNDSKSAFNFEVFKVDEEAYFLNFKDFITKNMNNTFDGEQIIGKCYLSILIEKDGKISDIKIRNGVSGYKELDQEAIRLIKLTSEWIPAKIDGINVKSRIMLL